MNNHFTVEQMRSMQQQLQARYHGKWEPIGPETGKASFYG